MPLKLQQRGVYCVERESGLLHFERERERDRERLPGSDGGCGSCWTSGSGGGVEVAGRLV